MVLNEVKQNVTLVNGTYNSNDAQELICSIFKERLNDAKVQNLRTWFKNNKFDVAQHNAKLEELSKTQEQLINMIKIAHAEGKEIEIFSNIEIKVKDSAYYPEKINTSPSEN
jgi:dihydroorotase